MCAIEGLEEPLEEIVAIVWAGGGFGVVLDAEGRKLAMVEAFDRVVIEAAVGDLQVVGERFFLDGEAVVLRRDLDRAGFKILHGVVRTAMTELELERLRAAGQTEQLVAEADAEDRLLAQQAANRADRVVERLGIAGAIREEHAVRLDGEHVFGGGGPGQDRHPAAHVEEVPWDVPLHAEIECDDVGRAWLSAFGSRFSAT